MKKLKNLILNLGMVTRILFIFGFVLVFSVIFWSILHFFNHNHNVHIAIIIQTGVFLIGAILTIVSLGYLRETGKNIENQTKASFDLAELTKKLLEVEVSRDSQINLVSAYITCEAIKINRKNTNSSRGQASASSLPVPNTYKVNVIAHINNLSTLPIFQIVAKLHKRQTALNGNVYLTTDDIPISVVGPKTDREVSISDNFKESGFSDLQEFNSLDEAREQAKIIEVEYSIVLYFRSASGLFYEGNAKGFEYVLSNEQSAISMYQNAVVNSSKKKPRP